MSNEQEQDERDLRVAKERLNDQSDPVISGDAVRGELQINPMQSSAPPDDRALNGQPDGQNSVISAKNSENESFEGLPLPDAVELSLGETIDQRWLQLPKRAQQIMSLLDLGYERHEVADLCRITPHAVSCYVNTYDPQRVLRLSPASRKAILAHRFSKLANQAIQNVTPEKLQASSAAQLTTIAAIAVDKFNALAPSPSSINADSDGLELKLSVMFKRGDTTGCG